MRMLIAILLLIVSGCRENVTQQKASPTLTSKPHFLNINGGFESVSVGPYYSYTTKFEAEICKDDFEDQPQWVAGTANPPLSAHDAMLASAKHIDSLAADGKFPEGSFVMKSNSIRLNLKTGIGITLSDSLL